MTLTKHIDRLILLLTIALGLGVALVPQLQEYSFQIFLGLVFLLGIPHGSLDHVIYLRKSSSDRRAVLSFILVYLGIMAISGLFWLISPSLMLPFFLLVSAFHFGQSQLFYIRGNSRILKNILFLAWGTFLLSLIIRLNFQECLAIFKSLESVQTDFWMNTPVLEWMIYISGGITILGMFFFLSSKEITHREFIYEFALVLLISVIANFTNAVFAFALYFGIWHSLKSMVLEYEDLKKHYRRLNLLRFFKLIAPFSIAGVLFLVTTYFLTQHFSFSMSPYMLFIILISCLTFPHLYVMADLYSGFSKEQD